MKTHFAKQTLSILMSLLLLVGLLPTAAHAYRANNYPLSGSGSASDPFLIQSASDWNAFAAEQLYQDNGWAYDDGTLYYKLDADITVSDTVSWDFDQFFDGGGHTITLDISDAPRTCALFRTAGRGAVIENLNVTGTIRTAEQFSAGLVGEAISGRLTIRNCSVAVVIDSSVGGDGTHGGFIARTTGGYPEITIEGSTFTGQIKGANTDSCGGFVGWLDAYASLTIRDSLYLPSGAASDDADGAGSAVIARYDRASYTQPAIQLENVYYSRALGETDDAVPVDDARPVPGISGPVRTVDGTTWYALASVSGIETSYTHTGSAISVEPVVTFNGAALQKDTDYSVAFQLGGAAVAEVKDAGTYTAVITGLGGDYEGSEEIDFQVLTTREVSTWQALHDALADDQTDVPIRLSANLKAVGTDQQLVFNAPGHAVTLDLNGFVIDLDHQVLGYSSVLTVEDGTLTIADSVGGGSVTGGEMGLLIDSNASVVLAGGAVRGNSGSGVYNRGTFTMTGGEISGNTAQTNGGGVSNSGTFFMTGGEISGNTAIMDGGGVSNGYTHSFTMSGGEITGNTALGKGGGIYNAPGQYLSSIQPYTFPAAEFVMTGGSITGNTADEGGGIYNGVGDEDWKCGVIRLSGAPVISGNLVRGKANNVFLAWASYTDPYDPSNPVDADSRITADGALTAAAQIGVTTGREPVAGAPVVFSDVLPNASDLARFTSDSAAYQVILTNDGKAALSSSTQSAWEDLKASMAAGGTIVLTRDVVYGGNNAAATESLTVPAGKSVVLDLNGYTIDRHLSQSGQYAQAFDAAIVVEAGGSLTIRDSSAARTGTITGGSMSGIRNDGTLVLAGGAVTRNSGYTAPGGGVYNTGDMTLQGGTVSNNLAGTGGGIYNEGTLRIVSGSVSENHASEGSSDRRGGGVYNAAGGTVEMTGGNVSANESYGSGGGVYNCGDFTMTGGSIGSNAAGSVMFYGDYSGGGVYNESGTFTVSGGSIANNVAATGDGNVLGGGIYLGGGSLEVSGSARITGNNELVRDDSDIEHRAADNVYLPAGKTVSVTGALSGALIGVTTAEKPTAGKPVVFTAGLDGFGDDSSFASDSALYAVELNADGEAQFNADHTPYQITVVPGVNGTVTVSETQAVETALVQVTLEANYLYRLDSLTVTADGGSAVTVTLERKENTPDEITVYSFRMPAGNVTVEAQFRNVTLDAFDLIFYADIAGTEIYRQESVPFGASLMAYANTVLEKDDYSFLGWTTQKHSGSYTYDETLDASIFFHFAGTMADEPLELYPVLLRDRFQIRLHLRAVDAEGLSDAYEWYDGAAFDVNTPASMGIGGDGKVQSRQFNVEWDEKIDMTAMDAAARVGYTLDGWETAGGVRWSADMGVTPTYADRDSTGAAILQTAAGLNYDYYVLTLSAVWTPKDIAVVYDKGTRGLNDLPGDTVALGETLVLPAEGPAAADGWIFVGWQAADKTLYSAGGDFLFTDWSLTEQETLRFTAVYLEAPAPGAHLLSFDSAGGSFVAPIQVTAGASVAAPKAPTLRGSSFAGWFDGDKAVSFPYTMPDHDVTLTARWADSAYTISFDTDGGTRIPSITMKSGEKPVRPADPAKAHYRFVRWDPAFPDVMPDHDLTLKAIWEALEYTVTFDANGGTFAGHSGAEATRITLSGAYGSPVTVPALASRSGYTFAGWTLNGKLATVPDTMPDTNPVYLAKWTPNTPVIPDPEPNIPPAPPRPRPFTDVPENVWFYDAVYECYDRGYLNGVSETAFAPAEKMTRAMFATVLYRVAGQPAVSGTVSFDDVDQNTWYSEAVGWAAAAGILQGYGDGRFGTNDFVSREQILTILWRLAGSPTGGDAGLSAFADADSISTWAQDAYCWALRAGILSGADAGLPNPKGNASRAEVATLIMNYVRVRGIA